jgi:hypothetical protein
LEKTPLSLTNKRKVKSSSLTDALLKSYIARAKLFYSVLRKKDIPNLFSRVRQLSTNRLTWSFSGLGIQEQAFAIVKKASIDPAHIFCHPTVLEQDVELLEYYRNLAALSQKGLSQILSGQLPKSRRGNNKERYRVIARILNQIISSVIVDAKGFSLSLAQNTIFSEIGAEIQGTWVNMIGQGAAKAVEGIIHDHAQANRYISSTEKKEVSVSGKKRKQIHLVLNNNWRIIFSTEPDVAIRDPKDRLKVAIEIKGSMDKAGAQTRLGEAKKSFAKAKAENAHSTTIYLASCFTDAVLSQLKTEREVDLYFNLIDILADEAKKTQFLEELFHYQIRIE